MRSLFIVLILTTLIAWSNPLKVTEIDKQINFYTFNGETGKADSLLNVMISKNPNNPKYYALKTPFYFYSRYFGPRTANSNDSLRNLILQDGQRAIDLAEQNEDDLQSKFYGGLAYAFMARVHMTRGEYWNAFRATDNAEDLFEEVLEEIPNNADALMAAAVREYFVENNLYGFTYATVYLLGFAGERQHALENLQKVASRGQLFKTEARFVLAILNRGTENDLATALTSLRELTAEFPNNNFIRNQFLQTEFLTVAEEKGADYLISNMDQMRETYNINNAGMLNVLGYRFINLIRIDDAIKVFAANAQMFPDVANCYDSLAEGYMINGQNDLAIKNYKIAYQKLAADSTINEQFREVLREGIEDRLAELEANLSS